MKNRSKEYNRHKSLVKAKRKQKIAKDIYSSAFWSGDYYNNLHQYSKNKIHCSCPMCNRKTNPKKHGKYRNLNWYGSLKKDGKCYTHKDIKRIEAMNLEYDEYNSI